MLTLGTERTVYWSLGRELSDNNSAILTVMILASMCIYLVVSMAILSYSDDGTSYWGMTVALSKALLRSVELHAVLAVPFGVYGVGWRVVQWMREEDRRIQAVELEGEGEEDEA